MDYKDYYAILGVPEDADPKEIKRAFRTLARQYHPDVNPDDPGAEQRFKEVNEANEVLSDPDKRAKYDRLRRSYSQWERNGAAERSGSSFDWSQWTAPSGTGSYRQTADAGSIFSDFFWSLFGADPMMRQQGQGSAGSMGGIEDLMGSRRAPSASLTRDVQAQVEISLEEAHQGALRTVSVSGRNLQVRIPPGAKTGTRVRIAGKGLNDDRGAGDLYLDVVVRPHNTFEREGDDLYQDVTVDLYSVVLGGEAQIPIMGGKVTMKIVPGTQPGQLVRLKGRGMPRLRQPDHFGDMYVRVNVDIPKQLSAKERALFRELANIRGVPYPEA